MSPRVPWLFVLAVTLVAVSAREMAPQPQRELAVGPAKVAPLQNLEIDLGRSHRPAYVPREWGRLVAVEKIGESNYLLFLQADNGDIFLVRLVQRAGYLYLDTYDQGGVVTVLRREP